MNEHSFLVEARNLLNRFAVKTAAAMRILTRRSPHGVKDLEIRVFECHECAHQIERPASLSAALRVRIFLFVADLQL
jgi:hypothetical protein